jgi:hypothetical protein
MAQTTVKLGDRYIITIKSHGKTIAKATGKNRDQARQRCMAQYQQTHGIRVL